MPKGSGRTKEADKIPYQPLTDYIDRRFGGATRLPHMGVWGREKGAEEGRYSGAEAVVRDDAEGGRVSSLGSMLRKARDRGWIGLHTADLVCCQYIGVHPVEVYGMEWYDFGTPLSMANEAWVNRWVAGVDGPASGRAKLNIDKVRDIRRRCAAGEKQAAVAADMGVSSRAVGDVVNGATWGWVDETQEVLAA